MLHIELPGYVIVFSLVVSLMGVQATANLVNSYKDFERGIDVKETAGDRTLVDDLVSKRTLLVMGVCCLACWLSFFAWSVVSTGFNVVVLSLACLGTLLAIGYTAGPAPLKYLGLGDLVVFLCFGPAVIAYSCAVLTGSVHQEAIVLTLPVTLFVVATLHANNYRDIEADGRTGARTVAIMLGKQASLHYYSLLLLLAHIGALTAGLWYGCAGAAASLFVAPQSIWLCMRIRIPSRLHDQDEETGKTTLLFGVALALGIVTMPGPEPSALGLGVVALVVFVLKVFAN